MSDIKPYQIPLNYKGKFNLMGLSLEWAGVIEGGLFGAVLGTILFLYLEFVKTDLGISIPTQIEVSAIIFAIIICIIFGMRGINGDPIHSYLLHVFMFIFYRKKSIYNPRVKYELTYERVNKQRLSQKQDAGLSNDISSIFQRYKKNLKVKQSKPKQEVEEKNIEYMFEDDVGVIEKTPTEMIKTLKRQKKKNIIIQKILRLIKGGELDEEIE